jgi:hypothetical protein
MFSRPDFSQICVLLSVHGCGLLSAALARIMAGGPWQALCHRLFIGLLIIVAFTAVLSLGNAPQHWFISAATFAVMVVTATADFAHPL